MNARESMLTYRGEMSEVYESLEAVARHVEKRKHPFSDVQTGALRNEIKETQRGTS